jgi:hypothetical protein
MKTLLKLITLSAAAVIAYKAYENSKKNNEVKENVKVDTIEQVLPKLVGPTRLNDALVQSFKVQSKVMIDSYPRNHSIDINHTISFIDESQLIKYAKYLSKENINHEKNMDDLSINLRSTIKTDAQEAFNDIIKVAESTLDYHGIYQGWVFENHK